MEGRVTGLVGWLVGDGRSKGAKKGCLLSLKPHVCPFSGADPRFPRQLVRRPGWEGRPVPEESSLVFFFLFPKYFSLDGNASLVFSSGISNA